MSVASTAAGSIDTTRAPRTTRRLIVTWQHPVERSISAVARLVFDGKSYRFHYIENARHVHGFRPFLGFSDLDRTYVSPRLFEIFAQRAMTPGRPDFQRWVTRLGLDDDATPWEQITRSGGRREGDTIQLFPEPEIHDGTLTCSFLVHGIRHVWERAVTVNGRACMVTRKELESELAMLRPGDPLLLRDEPDNPKNPQAILTTTTEDFPLGWVPDLLVADVQRIPDRGSVRAHVQRANGPDAGWHLRLLVRITAGVPLDFRVFEGRRWQPYGKPS